jgi:hypothetical protein
MLVPRGATVAGGDPLFHLSSESVAPSSRWLSCWEFRRRRLWRHGNLVDSGVRAHPRLCDMRSARDALGFYFFRFPSSIS